MRALGVFVLLPFAGLVVAAEGKLSAVRTEVRGPEEKKEEDDKKKEKSSCHDHDSSDDDDDDDCEPRGEIYLTIFLSPFLVPAAMVDDEDGFFFPPAPYANGLPGYLYLPGRHEPR